MINYNALGCCLDDVFYNTTTDATRKITSKLDGDVLSITFVTIKQHDRNMPQQHFMAESKREAVEMISEKVKSVKSLYKENTGSSLKISALKTDLNTPPEIITRTASSYSPKVIYEVRFTQRYTLEA